MTCTANVVAILWIIFIGSIYLIAQDDHQQARAIGSVQIVNSSTNFLKYDNSSFGMSIDYPTGWNKIEDNTGSWFRNSNESVNVRIEKLPSQNKTIDELTKNQINLTKNQFPGQVYVESNATTIGNNYTAHKIVFTFPEEPADPKGTRFKEMKVWTVKEDKAYIFSYFTTKDSYDYYLPLILQMIKSFRMNSTSN
jgi:hypothetical protein